MYRLTLIIKEYSWQEGEKIKIYFKTFDELRNYVKTFKPDEYEIGYED